MTDLFLKLLDMSLSASWIVLAVITARLVLKKAPRWMICGLWALVALRLVCPFSLESMLSLVPELPALQTTTEETLPNRVQNIIWDDSSVPGDRMTVAYPNKQGENVIYEVYLDEDGTTKAVEPRQIPLDWPIIATYIWVAGIAAMLIYAAASYLRIRKKVQVSIDLGQKVFLCDYIDTPFILGIVKPIIYLPSAMDSKDAAHVLAHERAHLKRKDHWWKPLGYVLLCLYWFNPLLWVAYILLCRDIELACDERVVKDMGVTEKKAYSEALLKCSVPRHMIVACPLAFGEVGVKQRVKSVLHYKKPSFWVLLVSVIVIIVVAVCFLTDPVPKELEFPFEKDLWTTELVYSEDGSSLKDAPSELLETINVSRVAASTVADYYWNGFEEVTLTEVNFDAYLSDAGVWSSSSARQLRKENVNAWVLHDTDYQSNYHDFYYLLQQKNGNLYLTQGIYWNAKLKPGETYISWIVKLENAKTDVLLVDIDTPFLYTRILKQGYLADPNGLALTAYALDGSQADYEVDSASFFNLLHSIPETAFSLGTPIQDVETSLVLDLNGSDYMDVTLRYGEGKVDLVFHWNAPWDYADTGNKAWNIHSEDLNAFFHRYSRKYILPQSMMEPNDPYQWCQDADISYMNSPLIFIFSSQALNGANHLGVNQTAHLLSELKKVPASAFVPSDFDANDENLYASDGGHIWLNYNFPANTPYEDGFNATIDYFDGHVYFTFYDRKNGSYQVWEILEEDFIAYQASLYVLRAPFTRTSETPTGTLTVSHGYASISMDIYDFLEYETVDYVDDHTPFGIRFRPKGVENGWIFYAFCPDGFTADPFWESSGEGQEGQAHPKSFHSYSEIIDDAYFGRARQYTNLPGDYVILYENSDPWLYEYQYEVTYLTGWGKVDLAADYLTSNEIMDLAFTQLKSLYVEADGKSRRLYPTFDYLTGVWTIATQAEEGHEPVVALQMDVYGNVLNP